MNNNIKYLLIGIATLVYGCISYTNYRKWHKQKFGFNDNWAPVSIKAKGIIAVGIIIIIVQILRIIEYIE